MLEIVCYDSDGRVIDHLTQWDVGQSVSVRGATYSGEPVFHFCNRRSYEALVVTAKNVDGALVAYIPNVLLTENLPIEIYMYYQQKPGAAKTVYTISIPVEPRKKPADYIFEDNVDYVGLVEINKQMSAALAEVRKAVDEVKTAVGLVDGIIGSAQSATNDANAAAVLANTAAGNADTAAGEAKAAAQAASTEAKKATDAAGEAKAAAQAATSSAGAVDSAVNDAKAAAKNANDISAELNRKLAAGEFNGKTPVKGVDYFTEAEGTQFRDEVYAKVSAEIAPVLEATEAATQKANTASQNADAKASEANIAAAGATAVSDELRRKLEAGELNGKTPVKGEDYFTPTEEQQFEDAVYNRTAEKIDPILDAAGTATNEAKAATQAATNASGEAKAAAQSATTAATEATTSKNAADESTRNANLAAENANEAATKANEAAQNATISLEEVKKDVGNKLDKPTAQPAAGQILKVRSTNPDGSFVVEWADDGGGTVSDVRINGNTIVQDGAANIPTTGVDKLGVVAMPPDTYGIGIDSRNRLGLFGLTEAQIRQRYSGRPLMGLHIDTAVRIAMCDGKGKAWTAEEQAAARDRMGIEQLTDIDSLYRSLVNVADDTQTVDNLFVQWWGSASKTEEDKVKLLERWFGTVLTDTRVHGVKMPLFATSQSYIGELTDDSAGLVCEPSTSAKAGRDDFAHLPQFWTLEVAMERNMDGTHTINKIEHIDPIEEVRSGNYGLCQVLQKNTWTREWTDAHYHYMQMCCNPADESGWHTWPQGTSKVGRVYAYIANPKYAAGVGSDGVITCGTGLTPVLYTSHTQGVSLWRKRGAQYSGGSGNLIKWQMAMFWLKYAKKGNSGIIEGCSSYYKDLKAAVSETGVSRVIVNQSQGKSVLPGSTVSVGTSAYGGQIVKIGIATSVEDVVIDDVTYTAITVDADGKTWDTVAENTHICTLPWASGRNDHVLGYDGSNTNPSAGAEPGLIQRTEFMNGAYCITSDEMFEWKKLPDGSHTLDVYVCEDQSKVSGNSITSDYVKQNDLTLTFEPEFANGWYYIEDVAVPQNHGTLWPAKISKAAGSGTGVRDAVYIGVADNAIRASWRLCLLSVGGLAGLAAFLSHYTVGASYWNGSVGSPSGISG